MENNGVVWWEANKHRLALLPALLFWVVSMICFVFGLSFNTATKILFYGVDFSLVIAISLSLSNTFVQIVGNDQDTDKMDVLFKFGWWASYLLGIGSNVSTLSNVIGIPNIFLRYMVCIGLGTIIEVMPERLFVQFLRSVRINFKKPVAQNRQIPQSFNLPKIEENRQVQQPKPNVPPFIASRREKSGSNSMSQSTMKIG